MVEVLTLAVSSDAISQSKDIELYGQAKERIVSRFTHDYVSDLLAKTGGNVTRAAELSGLSRASLQKVMRRLGIKSAGFRKED